ncbi:MAG: hypothetical protein ABJA74_06025 [Lapillicoccus sp.]
MPDMPHMPDMLNTPDQRPDTPQDAQVTQPLPTASTKHVPAAAWPTWVPSTTGAGPDSDVSAVPAGTGPQPTEHLSPVEPQPARAGGTPFPPASAVASAPARTPAPQPHSRPQVTYLPPPTGPNWGLVVVGLVFGLVGAGVVANQVAGFQVSSLSDLGPSVLVIAGLACALLGIVGILTRRRRG